MYVSSSCTCTDLINSFVCGPFGLWSMVMLKMNCKRQMIQMELCPSFGSPDFLIEVQRIYRSSHISIDSLCMLLLLLLFIFDSSLALSSSSVCVCYECEFITVWIVLTVHCMDLRHLSNYHRPIQQPLDHYLWTILTNANSHTIEHLTDNPVWLCDLVILILFYLEWEKKANNDVKKRITQQINRDDNCYFNYKSSEPHDWNINWNSMFRNWMLIHGRENDSTFLFAVI